MDEVEIVVGCIVVFFDIYDSYRLGSHGMKITILRHDLGNICLKPFPAALWPRKNRTRGKDAEGGGAKLPSQVVFLPTFFSRVDCYTP